MLIIRLLRVGKKNQPFFKIVVTDKKNPPKGGRFVEQLGFYNPLTKEKLVKKERITYWISHGAKLSDACHNLFVREGILEKSKIPVHKKSKKKKEKAPKEEHKKETVEKKEEAKDKPKKEEKKEEAPEKPKEAPKEKEPKKKDVKKETPEKESLKEPPKA